MDKTLHLKLLAVYKAEFHRRILEPLGILKAEDTRAVVDKTLHMKLLAAYKTKSQRRVLEPFGTLKAEHTRAVVAKTLHLKLPTGPPRLEQPPSSTPLDTRLQRSPKVERRQRVEDVQKPSRSSPQQTWGGQRPQEDPGVR